MADNLQRGDHVRTVGLTRHPDILVPRQYLQSRKEGAEGTIVTPVQNYARQRALGQHYVLQNGEYVAYFDKELKRAD